MRDRITVILLCAVALCVRLAEISGPSVWTDEAATFYVCRMPFGELMSTIFSIDVNPPFSYLLFWLWGKLSDSLVWMRSLSALFSVATVGLIFFFGKKYFTFRAGLFAAGLYALLPLSVALSRQVRYPAMLTFFVFAATWALISLLNEPTKKKSILYAALALCAAYTHYFAVFMFLAHIVLLFSCRLEIKNRKPIALAIILSVTGSLPWLPVFIRQLMVRQAFGFASEVPYAALAPLIAVYFTQGWTLWSLPDFWSNVFSGIFDISLPDWFPLLLALPFTISVAGGFFVGAKSRFARLGVIFYFLVPITAYLFVSLWMPQFNPQYFLPFLPPACLLCGAFWDTLMKRSFVTDGILVVLVIGISTGQTADYFQQKGGGEDWKNIAKLIRENWTDGDIIVLPNAPARVCFEVYSWGNARKIQVAPDELPDQKVTVSEIQKLIGSIEHEYKRAWLIDYYPNRYDPNRLLNTFLASKGFEISAFKREDHPKKYHQVLSDNRLRVRLFVFDRALLKKYAPRSYDMAQFESDVNGRNVSGVYAGIGDMKWTARKAEFLLYVEDNEKVCMEGFAPSMLYPESILTATMSLLDIPQQKIGKAKNLAEKDVQLMGTFWTCTEPVPSARLVRFSLKCHLSFIPDSIFHDGDTHEKCLQLRRVWVEADSGAEHE